MVRIKNRYLLVNILYPELSKPITTSKNKLPDVITFHQPTTNTLTSRALEQGIKNEIENLFGDYGYGAVRDSINGMFFPYVSNYLEMRGRIPPNGCVF